MSRQVALASLRKDASPMLWTAKAGPLAYGRESFRFRLIRSKRKLPMIDLDPWVESASWGRENAKRVGQVSFRRPLSMSAAAMVAAGDEIRCDVALWGPTSEWRTLWRMKVATPTHQIVAGILSLSLSVSLDAITKSKLAWKFRKGKAKPRGWTADEITRSVCKRLGVPVGSLPRGTRRIHSLVRKKASGHDIIAAAWKLEREETGRRYDLDVSTGRVVVRELREPRYMLQLRSAIIDAVTEDGLGNYATVLVAVSSRKAKGSQKARKLRVRVVDEARRRRHGTIVKTVTAPSKIDTAAELRRWAKRRLARSYMPRKSIEITHPGSPLVDRGDAVRVLLPAADMHALVFVTSVQHEVSAGSYTMRLSAGFADPYEDLRKARVKRKKKAAAARRRRGTNAINARTGRRATIDPESVQPKRAATRKD